MSGKMTEDVNKRDYALKSSPSTLHTTLAGGGAGIVCRIITSPLDVLKIRFQLQLEPKLQLHNVSATTPKYLSLYQAIRTIVTEEGFKGLWKGNMWAEVMYISYGAIQFTMYSWSYRSLSQMMSYNQDNNNRSSNSSSSSSSSISFVSGSIAGGAATMSTYPLDLLRTRFVAQGEPKTYKSSLDGLQHIIRSGGLLSLYRGLTPTMLMILPYAGMQFFLYDALEKISRNIDGSYKKVFNGAIAGATAKLMVMPLDVVKKRLQIQGFEDARRAFGRTEKYDGMLDCFKKILKQEGSRALFKGCTPSLIKSAVATTTTFWTYEYMLSICSDYPNDTSTRKSTKELHK